MAEVLQGDAKATGLPRESFDLATARLVLVNVPEPERKVDKMVRLVKRDGVVALHEADWGLNVCDPPLPAWDRLLRVLVDYAKPNRIAAPHPLQWLRGQCQPDQNRPGSEA